MSKTQLVTIAFSLGLFLVLYLGCDTKPKEQYSVEQSRVLSAESTGINMLLKDAKEGLDVTASSKIMAFEKQLDDSDSDAGKAELYKQLSGAWYGHKRPGIAGYYAEQVADIEKSAAAWSIAGTTYAAGLGTDVEGKVRDYCMKRAVNAFESAISLEPESSQHQVNLALCYANNPPEENPMKGIRLLLDLNKKSPDDVLVLNNLARLGIKTGQFDKAVKRLERVISLDANNLTATCLLAQAYNGLGDAVKAAGFTEKCGQLKAAGN